MLDREDTRHVVERGSWRIPENFSDQIDQITFRFKDYPPTAARESFEVKYCLRDTLPYEDPVPRGTLEWPTPEMTNFFKCIALLMKRGDLSKFCMQIGNFYIDAASTDNWAEALTFPDAEARRNDASIYQLREYQFEMVRTKLPGLEAGERCVLSIRRANLPGKIRGEDLSGEW